LTYAKNLALGNGFVYNHPPATYGTTSPLTALLVGGAGYLLPGVNLTLLALLLTSVTGIGTAWVFIFWRSYFSLSIWESIVISLFLLGNMIQYWGGENALFMFMLVLSVALVLSRRWLLGGICAGLLYLVRGEGALIAPILLFTTAIILYLQNNKIQWRQLYPLFLITFGVVLVIALWSLYAWNTFGTLLPNTLNAKIIQGQMEKFQTSLFHHFLVRAMPRWSGNILFFAPKLHLFLWALAVLGLFSVIAKRHRFLPILVWTGLYTLSYTLLRVPGYAGWYQLPVRWTWCLCVAIGTVELCRLADYLSKRYGHGFLSKKSAAAIACSVLLIWWIGHAKLYLSYQGDKRASCYLSVADYLNENSSPEDSVLAGEIGYLGFFTRNRIIDAAGLIDAANQKKTLEQMVFMNRPDYYMHWPPVNREEVRHDVAFRDVKYQLIAQFDSYEPGTVIPLYIREDKISDDRI
jgi:hypothetical protein